MTNRILAIDRLDMRELNAKYHLAIGTVGYERRSRYLFETRSIEATMKIAAAFPEQNVLSYDENIIAFAQFGFEVEVVSDQDYRLWVSTHLARAAAAVEATSLNILVDISSLSRVRIASLISAAKDLKSDLDLKIDFVYCLASYVAPMTDLSPNSHVGPVTAEFAGWWIEPDRQLSAIVGLGYEQDKALGAVEYLEAADVWVFEPVSEIADYSSALLLANSRLLASAGSGHLFKYRVEDPFACLSNLRSLTLGLASRSNVVLLPFGPKIFALCCLLVGASSTDVAVWRVSAQEKEIPVDRVASGSVYGLQVTFQKSSSVYYR